MKQKGFTIIELIIVIFIVGLLTTSVLISYRGVSRGYALDQGIQQLLSDLRRAQHMSMNGVDINETTDYCGYGLVMNLNATSTIFYADKHATDCDLSNNIYGPEDVLIETIALPQDVSIIVSTLDVLFKYPEPNAFLNGISLPGTSRFVTLKVIGTGETNTITMNTAGLIQGN